MKNSARALTFAIAIFTLSSLNIAISSANCNQFAILEISEINPGSRIGDVYVNNDVLFMLDVDRGLRTYNISDPSQPRLMGFLSDSYTFPHELCYANDLLYVADYTDGLEIVNISNPAAPRIIGRFNLRNSSPQWTGSTDVHITGNLAFLASQGEGVQIIDISDPTNPVEISSYYQGTRITRVYAIETLLFLAEVQNGFKILDVSDRTTPLELNHVTEVISAQSFFVREETVYVPDWTFGLRIFNIYDASNVIKIGEIGIDGRTMKCVVNQQGDSKYAYVAAWNAGLRIYDVTDPANSKQIAQYNDGGQSISLFVQDNLIFVAEFGGGLEILMIEEIAAESTKSASFEMPLLLLGLVSILIQKGIKRGRTQKNQKSMLLPKVNSL